MAENPDLNVANIKIETRRSTVYHQGKETSTASVVLTLVASAPESMPGSVTVTLTPEETKWLVNRLTDAHARATSRG